MDAHVPAFGNHPAIVEPAVFGQQARGVSFNFLRVWRAELMEQYGSPTFMLCPFGHVGDALVLLFDGRSKLQREIRRQIEEKPGQ